MLWFARAGRGGSYCRTGNEIKWKITSCGLKLDGHPSASVATTSGSNLAVNGEKLPDTTQIPCVSWTDINIFQCCAWHRRTQINHEPVLNRADGEEMLIWEIVSLKAHCFPPFAH